MSLWGGGGAGGKGLLWCPRNKEVFVWAGDRRAAASPRGGRKDTRHLSSPGSVRRRGCDYCCLSPGDLAGTPNLSVPVKLGPGAQQLGWTTCSDRRGPRAWPELKRTGCLRALPAVAALWPLHLPASRKDGESRVRRSLTARGKVTAGVFPPRALVFHVCRPSLLPGPGGSPCLVLSPAGGCSAGAQAPRMDTQSCPRAA